jgi:hypothetical protein
MPISLREQYCMRKLTLFGLASPMSKSSLGVDELHLTEHVNSIMPLTICSSLIWRRFLVLSARTNLRLSWYTGGNNSGQIESLGTMQCAVGPNCDSQMDSWLDQFGTSLAYL